MTDYAKVAIGDLFEARSGLPKFIRDYVDAHPGEFPVYSASLTKPFGYIDQFDYEGTHLTWVMNGYGGRVEEISGRFSANRDRGVFVPRNGVELPDLTYLRFAMEPQLTASAVGRRTDGRLNEYTKIYPTTAESVLISLPLNDSGEHDLMRMTEIGNKLRRIEVAQEGIRLAQDPLERAVFLFEVSEPFETLSLSDATSFQLTIGERVLKSEHTDSGVPVYSANALAPFGHIGASNLGDFEKPSLLWGIDGVFDWNLIPAGKKFATTDHCGRLQILDERLDPEYVFVYLKHTRSRYGFDRVFRASLRNVKTDVSIVVPLDEAGQPSLDRQQEMTKEFRARDRARVASVEALADVLKARMTVEM